MLILSGEGRVTTRPELRSTVSGKLITTVSVASSSGGSVDDLIYVDLVLWEVQAAFAAKHLVKGETITFSGRLESLTSQGLDGEQDILLQIRNVQLYGSTRVAEDTDAAEGIPA